MMEGSGTLMLCLCPEGVNVGFTQWRSTTHDSDATVVTTSAIAEPAQNENTEPSEKFTMASRTGKLQNNGNQENNERKTPLIPPGELVSPLVPPGELVSMVTELGLTLFKLFIAHCSIC